MYFSQDLESTTTVFMFELSTESSTFKGSRCLSMYSMDNLDHNKHMDNSDSEDPSKNLF